MRSMVVGALCRAKEAYDREVHCDGRFHRILAQ